MAIKSYEDARDIWRELANPTSIQDVKNNPVNKLKGKKDEKKAVPEKRLRPEQELFFEMSLGSVYESCGKDDIAISYYMRAKEV